MRSPARQSHGRQPKGGACGSDEEKQTELQDHGRDNSFGLFGPRGRTFGGYRNFIGFFLEILDILWLPKQHVEPCRLRRMGISLRIAGVIGHSRHSRSSRGILLLDACWPHRRDRLDFSVLGSPSLADASSPTGTAQTVLLPDIKLADWGQFALLWASRDYHGYYDSLTVYLDHLIRRLRLQFPRPFRTRGFNAHLNGRRRNIAPLRQATDMEPRARYPFYVWQENEAWLGPEWLGRFGRSCHSPTPVPRDH